MDFIANIIKRPKSMASGKQPAAMEATKAISPAEDRPSLGDRQDRHVPLVSLDLDTLLDSASEDLLLLEEQHTNLIQGDPIEDLLALPSSSSKDTIQQLLSEINVNLNQVSANEMEHLQAMSGEVCPQKNTLRPPHCVECFEYLSKVLCNQFLPC